MQRKTEREGGTVRELGAERSSSSEKRLLVPARRTACGSAQMRTYHRFLRKGLVHVV
jgi:hypothetical protein